MKYYDVYIIYRTQRPFRKAWGFVLANYKKEADWELNRCRKENPDDLFIIRKISLKTDID